MKQKKCRYCEELFEYKSDNQLYCEKCKIEDRHYKPVKVEKVKEVEINNYNELDKYELGQTIELNGHSWVIKQITGKLKKLYHCENELGIRECFDAIQLK